MKRKFDKVYQFKITLKGIRPPIWRRIQVPETYSFWDLHVAIQDAMGWEDCHLHDFKMVNPSTGTKAIIGTQKGIPAWSRKILSERRQKIADCFLWKIDQHFTYMILVIIGSTGYYWKRYSLEIQTPNTQHV